MVFLITRLRIIRFIALNKDKVTKPISDFINVLHIKIKCDLQNILFYNWKYYMVLLFCNYQNWNIFDNGRPTNFFLFKFWLCNDKFYYYCTCNRHWTWCFNVYLQIIFVHPFIAYHFSSQLDMHNGHNCGPSM